MRKGHPAFRMINSSAIRDNLSFFEGLDKGVVGYTINGSAVNDPWNKITVYFNGNSENQIVKIDGQWKIAVDNNRFIHEDETVSGKHSVKAS